MRFMKIKAFAFAAVMSVSALSFTACSDGTGSTADGQTAVDVLTEVHKDAGKGGSGEDGDDPLKKEDPAGWINDWEYMRDDADKIVTLTRYKGKATSLKIPAKASFGNSSYSVMITQMHEPNGFNDVSSLSFEDGVKAGDFLSFANDKNLVSVDFTGLDTSETTDMSRLFAGDDALSSVKFGGSFTTSNVTNMKKLFKGCSSMPSVDLSTFDTKRVTDMSYMFSGMSGCASFGVSGLDTRNVRTMDFMFNGCGLVQSLDLGSYNTRRCRSMDGIFAGCAFLRNLDLSGWNINIDITSGETPFFGPADTAITLDKFNTPASCADAIALPHTMIDPTTQPPFVTDYIPGSGMTLYNDKKADTKWQDDWGESAEQKAAGIVGKEYLIAESGAEGGNILKLMRYKGGGGSVKIPYEAVYKGRRYRTMLVSGTTHGVRFGSISELGLEFDPTDSSKSVIIRGPHTFEGTSNLKDIHLDSVFNDYVDGVTFQDSGELLFANARRLEKLDLTYLKVSGISGASDMLQHDVHLKELITPKYTNTSVALPFDMVEESTLSQLKSDSSRESLCRQYLSKINFSGDVEEEVKNLMKEPYYKVAYKFKSVDLIKIYDHLPEQDDPPATKTLVPLKPTKYDD